MAFLDSGIVATVFGATGFLGRYVVQQLGEMIRLVLYRVNFRVWNRRITQNIIFIQQRWDHRFLSHSEVVRIHTAT